MSVLGQDSIRYLTKPLEFVDNQNQSRTLKVGRQLTLFKIKRTFNDVTEVELIQENGQPTKESLFINSYWLKKGTESSQPLYTDLTPILDQTQKNLSGNLLCPPVKTPKKNSCDVLKLKPVSNTEETKDSLLRCFKGLQKKIPKTGTATVRLGAIYKLKPHEREFMAKMLTAYGEAGGARPYKQQLKAVMNVIDNRVKYARKTFPKATSLDVVFQRYQFSMYNPKDPNWKRALAVKDLSSIKAVIQAYIEIKNEPNDLNPKIYHYMATRLSRSPSRPDWATAKRKSRPVVDGRTLDGNPGHVFYKNVGWTFNPRNRYNR